MNTLYFHDEIIQRYQNIVPVLGWATCLWLLTSTMGCGRFLSSACNFLITMYAWSWPFSGPCSGTNICWEPKLQVFCCCCSWFIICGCCCCRCCVIQNLRSVMRLAGWAARDWVWFMFQLWSGARSSWKPFWRSAVGVPDLSDDVQDVLWGSPDELDPVLKERTDIN